MDVFATGRGVAVAAGVGIAVAAGVGVALAPGIGVALAAGIGVALAPGVGITARVANGIGVVIGRTVTVLPLPPFPHPDTAKPKKSTRTQRRTGLFLAEAHP
jgi:hypothetical protein